MVAEPTTATYSDAALQGYIERYPMIDERGEPPYTWNTATQPPSQDDNPDWIATYDLHRAAADVWDEKAGALAGRFSFSEGSARYEVSNAYEQAMKQARYHRSRRSLKTITARSEPPIPRVEVGWVGNRREDE